MLKQEKVASNERFKEYLLFQIHRNIVNLYKNHLSMVEDLKSDHSLMLSKLEKEFPKNILENVDYFSEEKYNYIRKKTLDIGNDAIRDFDKHLSKLEIGLK